MKKKTIKIILASTLLTSVFAISFPAIYISSNNKKNNDEIQNNNTNQKPPVDNTAPSKPDIPNTNLPPNNDEENSNQHILNYVTELDKIIDLNKELNLRTDSHLVYKTPSSIKEGELTLNDIDNFKFTDTNVIQPDVLRFKIFSWDDNNLFLTVQLQYENYLSSKNINIKGFISSKPPIEDIPPVDPPVDNDSSTPPEEQPSVPPTTENPSTPPEENPIIDDKLMAQRIYENNRVVDISNYLNVSKTIPMFFLSSNEKAHFKTDELKKYLNLPKGTDWDKVSFTVYMDYNDLGILKMNVHYGNYYHQEPIQFTGFKKASEWLNDLIDLNQEIIPLKGLNRLMPSQYFSKFETIEIDDLAQFTGKENIPDIYKFSNNVFEIVPISDINDEQGSLKAKLRLWLSSDEKIETEKTITINNFERKVTIAQTFAKLNPVIDIQELMKNNNVHMYEERFNFITTLTKLMASQIVNVLQSVNNSIYEIPWILKDDNVDISNSVVIDRKSNSIYEVNDVNKFVKNISFAIDPTTADDRYGTVDIYVQTMYSDNTFSALDDNTTKIQIRGLLDYSLVGIKFMEINEVLYVSEDSKLYNKDPKDVNYSEISLWSETNKDGDAEYYRIYEQWDNMMPKLKLVPVKNEKGEEIMPPQKDRLFAQVQIDGIDIKYPTSYRYIELIWRNK